MRGVVFDIKEFAVHDGPGLRTTVFLKGCPLRCIWCHNPEGIKKFPELMFRESACIKCGRCFEKCSHEDCTPFGRCIHICPKGAISVSGKEYEPDELLFSILKNESIIKDGGVTFSGGEPLYQHEFLLEMLNLLNGRLPRAIETSGYSPSHIFERVINSVELVYMDIKIADDVLHKKYVGVSNDLILKNLEILRKSGVPCIIRTPVIPHINDSEEEKEKILMIVKNLKHEFLPYNHLAGAKYKFLGKSYVYDEMNSKGAFNNES